MVGWHHQLNGHEFEQTPGESKGQGSLACCRPWGCKGWVTTERLNNNNNVDPDPSNQRLKSETSGKWEEQARKGTLVLLKPIQDAERD